MDQKLAKFLAELKKKALESGANDATIIDAKMISIEDEIITFCQNPRCGSYAKSANCPPYAMQPVETRKLVSQFSKALLFKTDVEPEILMSELQHSAFKVIFQIAARLETHAIQSGYKHAQGLAAGSCLPVFCKGKTCRVIEGDKECRYPTLARPSMEAVGMNVFKLIQKVGWEIYPITRDSDPDSMPKGVLAGLVLVA
jgi:predicted metal-binding protein